MPTDALEPVRISVEFWRRADVLASLEQCDIGALFRLIRQHAGASQTRIGIAVGMPQSDVSRIMTTGARQQRVTALHVLIRIADGLNMPDHARTALGLATDAARRAVKDTTGLDEPAADVRSASPRPTRATDHSVINGPDTVDQTDAAVTFGVDLAVASDLMKRRTLITWGVAAAGVAAVGSSSRPVGRIGASDVHRLQQRAARLYALDYQHGGDTLWHAARAMAADAYFMLEQGTYSQDAESSLLRATGRMLMCAGWLAFDAGHHDQARACYNEALSVAHQAADLEVEVHAFANLAFQSNVLGMPREGLRFANAAARAASGPNVPPRLAAVPQLRTAMALAASGDSRGSDHAIKRARLVLDYDADRPAEEWQTFLSSAELDGVEGTCALYLDNPGRAEVLLTRAIQGHSNAYARNRALYNVRLARARIDNGAIDGGAQAAISALHDLSGQVSSWRVNSELDDVARRLARHPQVEGVDTFLQQHALTSASNQA